MFTRITKELLVTKIAKFNEIIMLSIKPMINMKAAI